jgi:hypothetical protein
MIACAGGIDDNVGGGWGSSIEFNLIEIFIYVIMNLGRDPIHIIPSNDMITPIDCCVP